MCCSRCARNGEGFCILQGVEENGGAGGIERECSYSAEGVDGDVVRLKVEELMRAVVEKDRWALPGLPWGKREGLRRIVG